MAQTAVIYHPDYELHDTGSSHPETRSRARVIYDFIKKSDIEDELAWLEPEPIDLRWIKNNHRLDYINHVENTCLSGESIIDQGDTRACPASFEIARLAAGAAIKGVDSVLNNDYQNAFCCCRPPGHHALHRSAMGFCFFNNIAIAARYAQENYAINKILIIDWDVHHGNGTQDSFYEDSSVFFFSTHQYPFYPGTGAAEEKGAGTGLGYTLNIPMRAGANIESYRHAFNHSLAPAAENFRPELILISAGFDAHQEDPLAAISLEDEDFGELTALIKDIADRFCHGRIVSILEGGYNLSALPRSVYQHLNILKSVTP